MLHQQWELQWNQILKYDNDLLTITFDNICATYQQRLNKIGAHPSNSKFREASTSLIEGCSCISKLWIERRFSLTTIEVKMNKYIPCVYMYAIIYPCTRCRSSKFLLIERPLAENVTTQTISAATDTVEISSSCEPDICHRRLQKIDPDIYKYMPIQYCAMFAAIHHSRCN